MGARYAARKLQAQRNAPALPFPCTHCKTPIPVKDMRSLCATCTPVYLAIAAKDGPSAAEVFRLGKRVV